MEIKGIGRRTLTIVVTTIIATLLFLSLCTTSSVAAPTTYFGEDPGLGEHTPLSSHPNADAARAAFHAQIINPGTEGLEGFADDTGAPITVDFGAAGMATFQGGGMSIMFLRVVQMGLVDMQSRELNTGKQAMCFILISQYHKLHLGFMALTSATLMVSF